MTPKPTELSEAVALEPAQFQQRVGEWMEQCFTPEIIADKLERADRFIEEALELVQATGYSAERAHALVDYTFNRPIGEPFQEVGGVMVTLAALCNPHGLDMDEAAETELARIWTKIEVIRAKQATKPVGSALPLPASQPPIQGGAEMVADLSVIERRLKDAEQLGCDASEAFDALERIRAAQPPMESVVEALREAREFVGRSNHGFDRADCRMCDTLDKIDAALATLAPLPEAPVNEEGRG